MVYVLLLLIIALLVRYQYVLEVKIFAAMVDRESVTASPENKEEWRALSLSGNNPFRVISLASAMSTTMDDYEAAKHLTTSFYSQVEFLAKRGHIPTALAFYSVSRKCANLALKWQNGSARKSPEDFEVLGAPDFMAARIPIVGWFGFKTRAFEFLWMAEELLKGQPVVHPITAALIWAKLWTLSRNEMYRLKVRAAGLRRDMDENQLKRIAKHLGCRTLPDLYTFCGI